MYNNDNMPYNEGSFSSGKLPNRNFWQRNRLAIIAIISVLLVVVFASTTLYLLVTRPASQPNSHTPVLGSTSATPTSAPTPVPTDTPTPTETSTPSIGATTSASTVQPTTNLNTSTTNYQFVCLNQCDGKLGVVLTSNVVNPTSQTMNWNFNVTNNGTCSRMYGQLSLEAPDGSTIQPNGGTFTESIDVNQGQQLPRTATFSSIPKKGVQYTVSLTMDCDYNSDSYQPVLFTY